MRYIGAKIVATAIILVSAALLPMTASASGVVQIDTTITNVNGGTLDVDGLNKTQLVTPVGAYSSLGTPQFFIPAGAYQVIFNPPQGYTETHDSSCTGTVTDGQIIHCHVDYSDGAPALAPQTLSTPGPAGSGTGNTTPQPVSVPISSGIATGKLTTAQVSAIIGLLRAFGVDEAVVLNVEKILQ